MIRLTAQIPVRVAGYQWCRGEGGYFLGDVDGNVGVQLLTVEELVREGLVRVYDPFKVEPALFQIFAGCETIPSFTEFDSVPDVASWYRDSRLRKRIRSSILEFVNEWGCPDRWGRITHDKSIAFEVRRLREAIMLWEAVRTGDTDRMQKFVTYNRSMKEWRSPLEESWGRAPHHWRDVTYRKADVPERARELLHIVLETKVNQNLRLAPRRVPGNAWELRLEISDLTDVVWVQFAQAVVGDKNYERCRLCNRPFEVAPDVNRKSRKFCSDTCRVKHYQRRQARARRMWSDGMEVRSIAKELDTELATVKHWLDKT